MLAAEIARRFALAHPITRIHGGVSGDARQQAVDVFQTRGPGFDAMILSPKAGGVGLTLTAANHVVHLSRWWNPAVEDQATDRAYRIGQTRDVTVYLPQAVHPDPAVAPTSFDLKLHALMERKRTLSRGLLAPGDDAADADALFDAVVAATASSSNVEASVRSVTVGRRTLARLPKTTDTRLSSAPERSRRNQNSVCAPKTPKWRHTVDRLKTLFPSWNGTSSPGTSTFDSEAYDRLLGKGCDPIVILTNRAVKARPGSCPSG